MVLLYMRLLKSNFRILLDESIQIFNGDSISFAEERQWTADQKITEKDDHITIEFPVCNMVKSYAGYCHAVVSSFPNF